MVLANISFYGFLKKQVHCDSFIFVSRPVWQAQRDRLKFEKIRVALNRPTEMFDFLN